MSSNVAWTKALRGMKPPMRGAKVFHALGIQCRVVRWHNHFRKWSGSLKKNGSVHLSYDPSSPLLDINPKRKESVYPYTALYMTDFIAGFFVITPNANIHQSVNGECVA